MALTATATAIAPPRLVAIAMVAGLVAAFVMDWPMSRQPQGFVPAYIAASVVARKPVEDVRFGEALVLHHLAGVLAGVVYAVVVGAFSHGVPPIVTAFGLNLIAHLLAVGLVVGFIYSFFAHLVLPRAGGQSYEQQATAVRGQWLRSALVFGVTMLVVVPLLAISLL